MIPIDCSVDFSQSLAISMKQFLLPYLICPACLPAETPLEVRVNQMKADDIITGELSCKKCRRRFPIKNGIAILLSESNDYRAVGQLRYEESTMTDRYLWSHYGDLLGLDDYGDAHTHWAAALSCHPSLPSFDAGCAVGRLTFEMAVRSSFAVGCDLSHGFLGTGNL